MKVVAINGSPRAGGNTMQALELALEPIREAGIDTETIQIGNKLIPGCLACRVCLQGKNCVRNDEAFTAWRNSIWASDGLIIGSPAYYGGPTGPLKCFLDRLFFQSRAGGAMRHKIGGSVAVLRRSSAITTIEQINRYFLLGEMFTVPSSGVPIIYADAPDDVQKDAEGMYMVRQLGRNMAWLLQVKEAGMRQIGPLAVEKRVQASVTELCAVKPKS